MFSSPLVRKIVRVSLTSATAGVTVALLLTGGPAEAASLAGRGMLAAGGRGM